jgi:predicted phage terminase large subunit-like protein
VADFRTTAGGGRLATSVGGPMTGRGADLVVIDDPAKPDEMLSEVQRDAVNRWIQSTVFSRLNNKAKGAIVVAMQRLHVLDLTGYLLQDPQWKLLRLAAIAEAEERYPIVRVDGTPDVLGRREGEVLHAARESVEALQGIRQALGPYLFAAQYQQTPMAPDGNIVKLSWFGRYEEAPREFDRIVQSWDTASKTGELNSYSVCTTWGVKDRRAYLLHIFRRRLEYPDLRRAVIEQAALYKPSVILVEEKSSGAALLQDLKRENLFVLKEVKPTQSKAMRMHNQTAFIEGGFVLLPKEAAWLQAYETELMLFPIGQFDDQVDSTSQALADIQEHLQEPGLLGFYRMWAEQVGNGGAEAGFRWPEEDD